MYVQASPIEDEEADESWWSHILLTLVTDTTASPFHVLTNQAEKKKKKVKRGLLEHEKLKYNPSEVCCYPNLVCR